MTYGSVFDGELVAITGTEDRPVQDFGERVRLVEDPQGEQRAVWEGVR